MHTIRVHEFGGPERLCLESLQLAQPGPEEVLVALRAVGVNPVDTYIRSGAYGSRPLPYTPGLDGAGVIEALGSQVTHLHPGQRVYLTGSQTGTYASHALCRAHQVHPLPETCDFAQGAALGVPYPTAYRALFHKARARAGETVLVCGGSGGVGVATLQWAVAAGMRVFATASTAEGRALALEQGAEQVFDHSLSTWSDEVLKASAGRGVDVIIDMLANVFLDKGLQVLAPFGRIAIVGNRGRIEIDPRELMKRDASVHGVLYFNADAAAMAEIHAALAAGLRNRTLRPLIGRRFGLHEAPQAHEAVLQRGALGKIVLEP